MDKEELYTKVKSAYNEIARQYADRHTSIARVKNIIDSFIEKIPIRSFVLDAGCANGRDLDYLEKNELVAVGIDNSSELVKIAKEYCRTPVFEMDVRNVEFDDACFHGIWSNAVLHHLVDDDLKVVLKSFYRILKSNGVIFVTVKDREVPEWDNKYPSVTRYFNSFDKKKLQLLFEAAGFGKIEIEKVQDKEKWYHILAYKL